eukprot:5368495-Prymnesium_polylepis.1
MFVKGLGRRAPGVASPVTWRLTLWASEGNASRTPRQPACDACARRRDQPRGPEIPRGERAAGGCRRAQVGPAVQGPQIRLARSAEPDE